MEKEDSSRATNNYTTFNQFILQGLSSHEDLQLELFVIFLFIYLLTILVNGTITLLIWMDSRLHKPMYFFLSNLSFLDMCYSSITVPKTLANFLSSKKTIYFWGCIIQLFCLSTLVCAESILLSVMAYDRYVAICKPLFYHIIMNYRTCLHLALASWVTALLNVMIHTSLIFRLSFCSNKINHFLCEIPQLLTLSCTSPVINEVMLILLAGIISISTLLLIIISYMLIINSIMKIPSAESRRKTFSTCSSHLIVVTILYGSAMFFYLRPTTDVSLDRDKVISVLYTVITPLLNPLIYSFRNTEVKRAFQNLFLSRETISRAMAAAVGKSSTKALYIL